MVFVTGYKFHKCLNYQGNVDYNRKTYSDIFVEMVMEVHVHCLCVSEGPQQIWDYLCTLVSSLLKK